MIISKLVLNNIGVYAGRNELFLEANKPIILVGGLNGRGKTTILESILFALYGKRICSFLDYNIKFEEYLKQITNKFDGTNCGSVEVIFYTNSDYEENEYEVYHGWEIKEKKITFNTQVKRDGQTDDFLSENWGMFIEDILPGAIAPFFFFDGEKISELAASDNDSQLVSSIKSLLGLDIVDQSIEDLNILIRKKRKDIKNVVYIEELDKIDVELLLKENTYKDITQEKEELEGKNKKIEKELLKMEESFSVTGGNFKSKREELLRKKELLLSRIQENDVKMLEIVSGDLPLMMVMPILKDILSSVNVEKTVKSNQVVLEQLPQIYKEYCIKSGKEFEFDNFYTHIKENSFSQSLIYDLTDLGDRRLNMLIEELELKRDDAKSILDEQMLLKHEMEVIENHLSVNIDEDNIKTIYDELKKLTREKADLEAELKSRINHMEEVALEIENLQKQRLKILDRAVAEMEDTDKSKRTIEYSIKVKQLLDAYKLEVQHSKTKLLQKTMTDCIKKITAKKGLIKDVRIDPMTLVFDYYNSNGDKVNKAGLSAGEKQLLVIGMLWALGICSEKELPVVIDTPLARLDSLHREGLIDNYLPQASRQVIVLSTDQEISGEDYQRLKPYIGKEYTLVFDDSTMCTTIQEGYFGGGLQ